MLQKQRLGKIPKRAASSLMSCDLHSAPQTIAKFKCQKKSNLKEKKPPRGTQVQELFPSVPQRLIHQGTT